MKIKGGIYMKKKCAVAVSALLAVSVMAGCVGGGGD